ncbi:CoA-disulfide reductase [filamentous cyanobacterium CCT1]|nr:CoA-disulfide reductase [filamentous cyanobacterium CCT1]PSN79741.1 CoA-disulfide reductase [filamentous cyanobacterium CCP4]
MPNALIIGGSDAGISAALRIRELSPQTEVTVMLADNYPNFSICGLPFYLSGEVPDWRKLAHRTQDDLLQQGIRLLTNHRATAINPDLRQVTAIGSEKAEVVVPYDKLIIGTGATSRIPKNIEGLNLPGVYFLRWMGDGLQIQQHLVKQNPRSAVVIGGGYIGLEMADALTLRGLDVTLVEHSPTVLKTVHPSFGKQVAEELQRHGVRVELGIVVERIETVNGQLRVTGSPNFETVSDLVLTAVGATPAAALAQTAGLALGDFGAIRVNRRMETNVPHVYAAGDCVETWHRLLQKPMYMPLGTTAHKQGRIAGENAVGGNRHFEGTLGTQVVKVFDLAIARTGLRDDEANAAGYHPITVDFEAWDHKVYYPNAHPLKFRVTGDAYTGQLLGAQVLGYYQGEVAKRVDIFATALHHGMTVEQVSDFDLSYTPPLSSPWDPVQMAAQAWVRQTQRKPAMAQG